MAKEILCAYGVDVDAVAGWLGSYGGEDSPADISRGLFAGEIGSPRLLNLFKKYNLRTTWFIPGHSIETFPEQMRMVVEAGHEIGAHGYSHENPISMTEQQEEDVLASQVFSSLLLCSPCQLETSILFSKFILVGKHPITTVNVAPGEWLRSLLNEIGTHLRFVCHRNVKPGFGQSIDRITYPGGAGKAITLTKVFH